MSSSRTIEIGMRDSPGHTGGIDEHIGTAELFADCVRGGANGGAVFHRNMEDDVLSRPTRSQASRALSRAALYPR